jgi:hypothetical protein
MTQIACGLNFSIALGQTLHPQSSPSIQKPAISTRFKTVVSDYDYGLSKGKGERSGKLVGKVSEHHKTISI